MAFLQYLYLQHTPSLQASAPIPRHHVFHLCKRCLYLRSAICNYDTGNRFRQAAVRGFLDRFRHRHRGVFLCLSTDIEDGGAENDNGLHQGTQ